ncbi:hypothetical protein KH5H1_29650 [Corallococcus caeni]|uniref:Uncharacterized protein n=1 Tax=Corallococcus caeni TaxID=3082388 RepID=A0ABQ6QPU9_9BACT|nr:hypothetical protein KH5H1_29650 [Corallococcus sp. KH5-1]GMU06039.1 hypothetical protein ASNO1_22920 [Corallococcus sp. NO1]
MARDFSAGLASVYCVLQPSSNVMEIIPSANGDAARAEEPQSNAAAQSAREDRFIQAMSG